MAADLRGRRRELYRELFEQALAEAEGASLGWLAAAAFAYQDLREGNVAKVRFMSRLSGMLGVLMVLQTVAWLAELAVS